MTSTNSYSPENDNTALFNILKTFSIEKILAFFEGQTESERHKYAIPVAKWLSEQPDDLLSIIEHSGIKVYHRNFNGQQYSEYFPNEENEQYILANAACLKERWTAMECALLSTVSMTDLKNGYVEKEVISTPQVGDKSREKLRYRFDEILPRRRRFSLPWFKGPLNVVAKLHALLHFSTFFHPDALFRTLLCRRPLWISTLIRSLMEIDADRFDKDLLNPWMIYRRFYHEGLCERITEDNFLFYLCQHMYVDHWLYGVNAEYMEKNPDLLENEFWLFFEKEHERSVSFTYLDSSCVKHQNFSDVFLDYVKRELVDRSRLLDGTLNVLHYHYSDYEMRWYSELHRQLQPSIEEIRQREPEYRSLLEDHNKSTVAFAFDMLVVLAKAKLLDIVPFLQTLPAFFYNSSKTRGMKALDLVQKLVINDNALKDTTLEIVFSALHQDAVELQTKAAKMLMEYSSDLPEKEEYIKTELDRILSSLPASVALILKPLCQSSCGTSTERLSDSTVCKQENLHETGNKAIIAPRQLNFGPLDCPRLTTKPVLPVESFEELLDLALSLFKPSDNPDDFERLYHGINRLHNERPENFDLKISPLRKRLLSNRNNENIRFHIRPSARNDETESGAFDRAIYLCLLGWAAEEITDDPIHGKLLFRIGTEIFDYTQSRFPSFPPLNKVKMEIPWSPFEQYNYSYYSHKPQGIIARRLAVELCRRIYKGISLVPLSTPTHHGGWIDPLVLLKRIVEDPNGLSLHDDGDKVLSLYRLAPDHRLEAYTRWTTLSDKSDYLVALGGILSNSNDVKESLPLQFKLPWLVDRAARTKTPLFTEDHDACLLKPPPLLSSPMDFHDLELYPPLFLWAPEILNDFCWFSEMYTEWTFSLCPALHDPMYWNIANEVYHCMFSKTDIRGIHKLTCPLFDPNEPMTYPAVRALLLALNTLSDSIITDVVDLMILAIQDGRLNAELLADAARYWLTRRVKELLPSDPGTTPPANQQEMTTSNSRLVKLIIINRWLKQFRIIAAQSPLHAEVMRCFFQKIVPLLEMKELAGLLELLKELCVSLSVPLDNIECIKYLQTLTGSGKAAKLAKALLQ